MRKFVTFILSAASLSLAAQESDSVTLKRIYDYFLTNSRCYTNLEHLTKKIGARLSGSDAAEKAVQWSRRALYEAGADTVILQPCMVPVWVRGEPEYCGLSSKKKGDITLLCRALGSSVGTGEKGIDAQVVEVRSYEHLDSLGEKSVKGKIVFYNVFFDKRNVRPGHSYGQTVKYRATGASHAAKYGAVAVLVRSMTTATDDEPHTGNMRYDTTISKHKIPAVALGYKSADLLHAMLRDEPDARVTLVTNCKNLPEKKSFNVVGQINGSTNPSEYIIAGGHLDSWDIGEGAHDDGAGIVQCIEMIAAFKKLNIKPRHSVRAVMFMNEENGLAGGKAYAAAAVKHHEKHIAALETDAGGYTPRGFGVDTLNGLYKLAFGWKNLFYPYYVDRIEPGGGGADLIALEALGVPCIGFEPDTQRYFDLHHTAADTFEKINRRELELGGGAIASLIYLIDKHIPTPRR